MGLRGELARVQVRSRHEVDLNTHAVLRNEKRRDFVALLEAGLPSHREDYARLWDNPHVADNVLNVNIEDRVKKEQPGSAEHAPCSNDQHYRACSTQCNNALEYASSDLSCASISRS